MPAPQIASAPSTSLAYGENLPADTLLSTLHRVSDEFLNGWHVCYHNNDDLVTAWRAEGGGLTEAEGYVDSDGYPAGSNCFHAQRMRVVAGAVDAYGNRTRRPGPWSRMVQGKSGYQYTLEGAAQLTRDGFKVEPNEVTPA